MQKSIPVWTVIDNVTTGKSVTHKFSGVDDGDLCETNAEWIVGDIIDDGRTRALGGSSHSELNHISSGDIDAGKVASREARFRTMPGMSGTRIMPTTFPASISPLEM
jgi:hypothetical protein